MVIEIIAHIERAKDTLGHEAFIVRGTRISVAEIVMLHVLNHSPIEWIAENYPLSYAQVYAALAYYYDHQAEIDRMMGDKVAHEREATQHLPTLDDLKARIEARGSK
ncbi:MAG: hypothetical protein BroJett018_27360 [Chloroflexota bacterium]|nr:MAG: hypothetical protein BroJett018_27360 [Chloroflexota bacterium]